MDTLPGCVRSIDLVPAPRWPVALRNTRALHGALTVLCGEPHNKREPNFHLLPWRGGCGWAVQWFRDGYETQPTHNEVHVFNGIRRLVLGPPMRLRRPSPPSDGAMLCVDTETPVLIRHSGTARASLTPDTLAGSIANSPVFERVLGRRVDAAQLQLEPLAVETKPVVVHVGGGWGGMGTVVGWEGRLVVRTNAVARDLLQLAALIGVGGRCSLGFGRVRVRVVQAQESAA